MSQPSSSYYFLIIILLTLVNGCDCRNYDIENSKNSSIHGPGESPERHDSSFDITKIVELPPVKNKGVINIGNSCYSNSTIQILASFYRELIAQKALDPNNKIAAAGNVLIKDMTIPQESPDLKKMEMEYKGFFNTLEQSEANGGIGWVNKCGTQEDADELLTKLFDHFNLPMLKIQYKLVNSITQEERLIENTKFPGGEPYNKLALPISKDAVRTMQDAVDDFFSPDTIDDYKWDGKTTVRVQKIPTLRDLEKLYNKVLVVSLKRYDVNMASGEAFKVNKLIGQPFHIKLKQEQTPGTQQDISYDLVAFITHSGGTGGGHYIAYVKVGGVWIQYNDSNVTEVSEKHAEEAAKVSYTFFYQQSLPSQG